MPTTPEIPEGLELRKDGTIVLHLDDENGRNQRVQLRRPKMKELRRLRETEWEIADEIRAFTAPLQDAVDAHLAEHDLDPGDSIALTKASTQVLRTMRDLMRDRDQKGVVRAEELRGPWAAEAIETLSDTRIDEDDLPPWCFGADFASALITHWLSVPTRRGSP